MKTWTPEEIKEKLLVDDVWLTRGLVAIFKFQTESEKASENTLERNSRGFNGVDGKILTSIAKFYQRQGFLSPKQTAVVRKKMLKYSAQLSKIANKKISL